MIDFTRKKSTQTYRQLFMVVVFSFIGFVFASFLYSCAKVLLKTRNVRETTRRKSGRARGKRRRRRKVCLPVKRSCCVHPSFEEEKIMRSLLILSIRSSRDQSASAACLGLMHIYRGCVASLMQHSTVGVHGRKYSQLGLLKGRSERWEC